MEDGVNSTAKSGRRKIVILSVCVPVLLAAIVFYVETANGNSAHPGSPITAHPGSPIPQFSNPAGAAIASGHVWITNNSGNYVSELTEGTDSLIRVIDAKGDFQDPNSITANASYVWVDNQVQNTVTQLRSSNGKLVRVLTSINGIVNGGTLSVCGASLWYANSYDVAMISINTGRLERVIHLSSDGESTPIWLSAEGSHPWVGSFTDNAINELNCTTGSVEISVRLPLRLGSDDGIATVGNQLWVSMFNSVVELNQNDGALTRVITAKSDLLSGGPISVSGNSIWVLSSDADFATQLNRSDGSLIRIFRAGFFTFMPSFAVASNGDLWVLSGEGNSVAVINGSSGRLIKYYGLRVLPS
jgi:hypothetical protein